MPAPTNHRTERDGFAIDSIVAEPRVESQAGRRGAAVVMLPSLGRPATDFAALIDNVGAHGFRGVGVEPRGIDGPAPGARRLSDLAADVAAVIEDLCGTSAPVHVVGHAFGNRLARCLAVDRPDLVATLTLLAAGGLVEPDPEVWIALAGCFDGTLDDETHHDNVAFAFFAEGNPIGAWEGGWHAEVAAVQRAALESTPRDHWWSAAAPRVLVIQGLQDRVAVPANGRRYIASLVEQGVDARLVEIDGAGHALLPEQPAAIAAALLDFLAES